MRDGNNKRVVMGESCYCGQATNNGKLWMLDEAREIADDRIPAGVYSALDAGRNDKRCGLAIVMH